MIKRTMAFMLGVAALAATPALADGGAERVPLVTNTKAKKECSACHMAFQPAFLPADAWKTMMRNLDEHFGENAFLMPETKKAIARYYTSHAPKKAGPMLLTPEGETTQRITETSGWRNAHREVKPGAFKAGDVGAKANCPACHKKASKGVYEDD